MPHPGGGKDSFGDLRVGFGAECRRDVTDEEEEGKGEFVCPFQRRRHLLVIFQVLVQVVSVLWEGEVTLRKLIRGRHRAVWEGKSKEEEGRKKKPGQVEERLREKIKNY